MTFSEPPPHRYHPKWLGPFKYLTWRQAGWMHFKLALGVWALFMILYTPLAVAFSLKEPIISLWGGFTIMTMASYPRGSSARVAGPSIELAGVILTFIGPAVYFTTQLLLMVTNADKLPTWDAVLHTRLALTMFAYCMCAALLTRLLILIRVWRLQQKQLKVTKRLS